MDLSFNVSQIESFYPGNEGAVETLGRVYDVTDQTFLTYSTIVNFAATCRTNLDLTNYGASNLLYKQDATGRWLGMADANLIEFTGDERYVDTGFMPPSDSAWEIDFIMETSNDGVTSISGVFAVSSQYRLYFGQLDGASLNQIIVTIGSSVLTFTAPTEALHHIRVEFDGSGNGRAVLDNSIAQSYAGSNYLYTDTESIFLGGVSRAKAYLSDTHTEPIGKFIYTAKERTVAERDIDYAKAKLLYPTLP